MAGASVRITADLRHRLVDRIMQLGPGWVTEERSGELEAVLVDGVEKLDAYFRLFLSKVIVAGISAVAIVIVIWIVDPVVGAVVAVFAAIVVAIPPVEYRALGSHMRFWSESYRPLAAEFVDALQGMATLKMFGAARRRGADLFGRADDVRDAAIRLTNVSAIFWGCMAFVAGAGVAVTLAVGAFRLIDGAITAGDLLLDPAARRRVLPAGAGDQRGDAQRGLGHVEVRAGLRGAGDPAARRDAPARPAGGDLATDIQFEGRHVPVSHRRRSRDRPGELRRGAGRDGGDRGALGRRQDHARLPAAAVRRSAGGHGSGGRPRHPRARSPGAPADDRARPAGHVPVPRDGRREPPAGPGGRERRGSRWRRRVRRCDRRSSATCRRGSTRSSASEASGSPAASGSASRSRVPC